MSDIANELRRAAQPLHAPTTELIKDAAAELERLERDNENLRSLVGELATWLKDPPPPAPPEHICGPDANCDFDCMLRARMYETLDNARAAIRAAEEVEDE